MKMKCCAMPEELVEFPVGRVLEQCYVALLLEDCGLLAVAGRQLSFFQLNHLH